MILDNYKKSPLAPFFEEGEDRVLCNGIERQATI